MFTGLSFAFTYFCLFSVPLCDVAQVNLKRALDAVEQLSGPEVAVEVRGGNGTTGICSKSTMSTLSCEKKETAVNCHLLHGTQNLLWEKRLWAKRYVRVSNTEAL